MHSTYNNKLIIPNHIDTYLYNLHAFDQLEAEDGYTSFAVVKIHVLAHKLV